MKIFPKKPKDVIKIRDVEEKTPEMHTLSGEYEITYEDEEKEIHRYHLEVKGSLKEEATILSTYQTPRGPYQSLIFYQVLNETDKIRQIRIKGTTIFPDGDIKQFDKEVTMPKTTACDACKILFNLACAIGCGVGIAALCVLAGITTIVGGLACAAVAAAICYFISEYGCNAGAQYACEQLGYC